MYAKDDIEENFWDGIIVISTPDSREKKNLKTFSLKKFKKKYLNFTICIVGIVLLILSFTFEYFKTTCDISLIQNNYPSQSNKTWSIVLGALNKENSVQSILLLCDKNNNVMCDCFKKNLCEFSKVCKSSEKIVSFNDKEFLSKDYGEILEHYKTSVRKYKVLSVNLNKVPGSIAKMFHPLSDDIYPNEQPAILIYSLHDQEEIRILKPTLRARDILTKLWNELPENELFPLLSRITANVIKLEPELNMKHCD